MELERLLSRAALTAPAGWRGSAWQRATIHLGGGVPDPSSFPIDALAQEAESVLRADGSEALQYGGLYGYEGLAEWVLAKMTRDDGRWLEREQLMFTNGSSQAFDLLCRALLDPGDTVVVEGPTFPGFLRTLEAHRARIVAVQMDEQGMQVERLTSLLRRRRVKFIYTIPDFNNPTGAVLSLERRRELLWLAQQHEFVIVEDDPYHELRFEGADMPSLFSMDDGASVAKLRTFSKLLAPGLRVGWAAGPKPLIEAMARVRQDMGGSPFVARIVARYAASGQLEANVPRLRQLYAGKRDALAEALEQHCPDARFLTPHGGFFLWLELPEGVDALRLQELALEEDVGFVPGVAFYPDNRDNRGRDHLRLAFSYVDAPTLREGARRLGKALERARD